MRRFLQHINREWGTTILLTTHDLGDIEALCPRIIVIDQGRLILDDRLDAVRERLGDGVRITFQFAPERPPAGDVPERLQADLPGVAAHLESGARLVAKVPRDAATPIQAIRWVVDRLEPINLQVQESPIEEVVQRLYSGGQAHAD